MAKKPEVTADAKTAVSDVETVVIKLPRIRNAEDPVFVSVNDYTAFIKRGENVEVPVYIAEVLEHQEQMLATIQEYEEAHGQN